MKIDEVLIELAEELIRSALEQENLADTTSNITTKIVHMTVGKSLIEVANSLLKVAQKATS